MFKLGTHAASPVLTQTHSDPLCMHEPAPTHTRQHLCTPRQTQTHKWPPHALLCLRKCACSPGQTQLSEPHTQTLRPSGSPPQAPDSLPWLGRVEKDREGWGLAQPLFPPSAGWLAPSCLAESASPAPAPAALAVLGKLSAGWSRLMPQQQRQQQGREGCTAANVADGGQGGRKEAGPVLRPLTGGDKTKGAG